MNIADYPQRIVIELTPNCNLACLMCPGRHIEKADGYMSGDLWLKLIKEISEKRHDAVVLPFWRGESLLHPEFTELMDHALNKSLRIHISTNGHIMGKEHAECLARCEFVTFSIHTMQGFENASKFLSIRNNGKPLIQLSFVRGEKTTDKLLASLISAPLLKGFDSIRLYEEHSRDGIFGKSSVCMQDADRIFCRKLEDTLVIAYDGSVSRCNHIWETEHGLDLNDISIAEAWSADELKDIRRNYPDGKCGQCDQWIGHTLGESWRLVNGKLEHNIFTAND